MEHEEASELCVDDLKVLCAIIRQAECIIETL